MEDAPAPVFLVPGSSFHEPLNVKLSVRYKGPNEAEITLFAADDPEEERKFDRLAEALTHSGVAHQSYRRSQRHGGRTDMIVIQCLPSSLLAL